MKSSQPAPLLNFSVRPPEESTMNTALVLLLSVPAAEPAREPEVRALLVTHLGFTEKQREKLAEAAVKMLSTCSSSCPSPEKDFESLFRQRHLHVKFANPRDVTADRKRIKVDELIVSFPTNTGGIWVRTGEDYHYFTKFQPEPCLEIQELLKAGKPQ
jgi:hypothetical protein